MDPVEDVPPAAAAIAATAAQPRIIQLSPVPGNIYETDRFYYDRVAVMYEGPFGAVLFLPRLTITQPSFTTAPIFKNFIRSTQLRLSVLLRRFPRPSWLGGFLFLLKLLQMLSLLAYLLQLGLCPRLGHVPFCLTCLSLMGGIRLQMARGLFARRLGLGFHRLFSFLRPTSLELLTPLVQIRMVLTHLRFSWGAVSSGDTLVPCLSMGGSLKNSPFHPLNLQRINGAPSPFLGGCPRRSQRSSMARVRLSHLMGVSSCTCIGGIYARFGSSSAASFVA
jgi:hypothetical protein